MRFSRQRQVVYQTLQQTDTHPDAQWVYNKVREVLPNISLGTVYRNLNELCCAGMVKRISASDNVERFDARTASHAHFVCRCCGKIDDVFDSNVDVGETRGTVESVEVMVYGVCSECMKGGNYCG